MNEACIAGCHWTTSSSCPGSSEVSGAGAVLFTSLIATLMGSQNRLGNPDDYPDDMTSHLLDEYDFIVVGAGSAGSVIASRLSEIEHWRVLLLEAGGDPPLTSDVPLLAPTLQQTDIDWKFKTEPQKGSCEGLTNRQCSWPRGKVLGGTSTINYFVYIRGMKGDFDEWAESGNNGWGFNDILPHFEKSVDTDIKEVQENKYHSKRKPLTLEQLQEVSDLEKILIDATEELGYKYIDNINGETQLGFTRFPTTLINGTRCNTAKAFLTPAKNRKNLHVAKNAHVTRLLIDPNKKTAHAVEFRTKSGKIHEVKFKNEVILSAGAINSPQILMLSGIGPKKHLEEIGISPIIKDSKVGENLQDHFSILSPMYNVEVSSYIKTSPEKNLDASYEYLMHRTGLLRTHPYSPLTGFIKSESSPKHERPNIQFHFVRMEAENFEKANALTNGIGFAERTANSFKDLITNSDVVVLIPVLLRPKSRGRILLKSPDPFLQPKIYSGYLTDVEGNDITTMIEGIRFAQKLMKTKVMENKKANKTKLYIEECESITYDTREYWECVLRQIGTTLFHPVGSCKMGPQSDPDAVVDPELKVHGVKGIRVADASIMPTIVSSNTNAAIIMIAEKAADFIKQEWLKE